jgi:hypothetical protein
MSAAEALKAQMAGLAPVKKKQPIKAEKPADKPVPMDVSDDVQPGTTGAPSGNEVVPGLAASGDEMVVVDDKAVQVLVDSGTGGVEGKESDAIVADPPEADNEMDADGDPIEDGGSIVGTKRTFEEGPGAITPPDEGVTVVEEEDEEAEPVAVSYTLTVKADGSVDQEDTVK